MIKLKSKKNGRGFRGRSGSIQQFADVLNSRV